MLVGPGGSNINWTELAPCIGQKQVSGIGLAAARMCRITRKRTQFDPPEMSGLVVLAFCIVWADVNADVLHVTCVRYRLGAAREDGWKRRIRRADFAACLVRQSVRAPSYQPCGELKSKGWPAGRSHSTSQPYLCPPIVTRAPDHESPGEIPAVSACRRSRGGCGPAPGPYEAALYGPGGSRSLTPCPPTMAVEPNCDRRTTLPLVVAYRGDDAPEPFVEKKRFKLVCSERIGQRTWVTLNAVAPSPPNGPPGHGSVECQCLGPGGRSRFEPIESPAFWSALAFQASDSKQYYNFLPDLFDGLDSCALQDFPGWATQWNPDWLEEHENGWRFKHDAARQLTAFYGTDAELQDALAISEMPAPLPVVPSHSGSEVAHRNWWVQASAAVQLRMGVYGQELYGGQRWRSVAAERPELHDRLVQSWYAHPLRGVWISDTASRAANIKSLIAAGVPVFYVWEDDMLREPACAGLCPPAWMLGDIRALSGDRRVEARQARPGEYRTDIQVHLSRRRPEDAPPPPQCSKCGLVHEGRLCAKRASLARGIKSNAEA